MEIIVVNNFFNNFSNIEKAFKKIPLYNLNKYNNKFNSTENWPGLRSENLFNQNPFLFNLILHEFFTKFKIPFSKNGIKMKCSFKIKRFN